MITESYKQIDQWIETAACYLILLDCTNYVPQLIPCRKMFINTTQTLCLWSTLNKRSKWFGQGYVCHTRETKLIRLL